MATEVITSFHALLSASETFRCSISVFSWPFNAGGWRGSPPSVASVYRANMVHVSSGF
ncbi:hypothetical protein PISMIDRAFT_684871 [Pisolithus microcarpus 441]|uniref:Uncharacterized protein n=1 Tax=Pisolithus microcarpus 441 TaxID=765257 RepID=A0A0C9Z5U9_9AGAM|nr:hypothetical protein PISMIDRAFT_684871 [Pisolithus microcarpus 441]